MATAVFVAVGLVVVAGAGLVAYWFPVVRRGLAAAPKAIWKTVWAVCWVRVVRCWWVARVRLTWTSVCDSAGLTQRHTRRTLRGESRERVRRPRLCWVSTSAYAVRLKVRTRRGQALAELEASVPRIAASYGAHSFRAYPDKRRKGNTLHVELVKRDLINKSRIATAMPEPYATTDGTVTLGRRQAGGPFTVRVFERQTLVVGASGSGKGSFLQGAVAQLAPSAAAGTVELWGIDLKGGMELAFCEDLLARHAYTLEAAVDLLDHAGREVDRRTHFMRGKQRAHTLGTEWPGLVVVIDELAMLTRVGDPPLVKDARTRLQSILTRGRAVGVVVLAFIQDPRKETLPDRGLFTQTLALRLRSAEEVAMVLGEGMAETAPAHRIPRDGQGIAYVIDEDGTVDRVRADFWPDDLVRQVAARYGRHITGPLEDDDGAKVGVVEGSEAA